MDIGGVKMSLVLRPILTLMCAKIHSSPEGLYSATVQHRGTHLHLACFESFKVSPVTKLLWYFRLRLMKQF